MTIIESRPWELEESLDDFVEEWLDEGKSPDEIVTALLAKVEELSAPQEEDSQEVSNDGAAQPGAAAEAG